MTSAEIYHRTYLPDGSYGPQCQNECHAPTVARPKRHEFVIPPEEQVRRQLLGPLKPTAVLPPKPEPYHPSQTRWRALQFTGKGLNPIFMVEKKDQNFSAYATEFERVFSKLASRGRFQPVVHDLMVVGHAGRVNGGMIFIPKSVAPAPMDEMLAAEIPVFVAQQNPSAGFWRPYYSPYVDFSILTSIDGQVLASFGMRDNQAIESVDPWILDVIFIGKGLADLGVAAGRRIIKSLMQRTAARASRRVLAGATRELAEEAAERMARFSPAPYDPRSGMTPQHFKMFQEAAAQTETIAVVRNTSTACTRLIEFGCPGKPLQIKFHTSPKTGVVTAENLDHMKIAYRNGYYVVDADGIARRKIMRGGNEVVEELRLDNAFWEVEPGQVIDPAMRKPLVGDYDLMGVISPKNAGQNVALHVRNQEVVEDITSPMVERFRTAVNQKMDMPRVLHGAQDQYAGFRGGATAFYPDGRVVHLADEAAVETFYQSLKRETIQGAYPRPPAGVPVVDELAARRARR